MCKGSGPGSTRAYVVREHGRHVWEDCLGEIAPELREGMDKPLPFAWYPIQGFDELFAGMFKHCCRSDPARADRFFRDVGRYIAEDNLNTIYRVVLSFAQSDHILGLLPRLWGNYFAGIDVQVKRPDPAVRFGTCDVKGLPLRYVGPAASGWIELAYSKVGCKNSRVIETGYQKGLIQSDALHYELRWS